MSARLTSNLLLTMSLLLISGCGDPPTDEDPSRDLSDDIKRIVPRELLQEIIDNGQTINRGFSPPNVEGTYDAAPFVLKSSNLSTDILDSVFAPIAFTISAQDDDNLSVSFAYSQTAESGSGIGGFLAGEGAAFSMFAEVTGTTNGAPFESVLVLSGERATGGIANLEWALFMKEDFADPTNIVLDPGQGRVFKDSDGYSPRR